MAKVSLVFYPSDRSEGNNELVAFQNDCNELYIEISEPSDYHTQYICLDLLTALIFKQEIDKIIESMMNEDGK